ncbi:PcfJ domain-containing protein [Desulfobacterales bacterium HSG17]|nr:PcfJ domain-containing protein [Desulfobacterales bacterium HSG17]
MKQIITVKNNQVICRNIETGKEIVQLCEMSTKAKDVVYTYTGIDMTHLYEKSEIMHAYQKAGDILGTSVANFCNMLRGATFRVHILPEKSIHDRFDWMPTISGKRTKWVRNASIIDKVNTCLPVIKRYLSDGNAHLAAFSMLTGDACQSKRILGKGLWKKLTRNSQSRNDLIWRTLGVHMSYAVDNALKHLIGFINNVPTTLLKSLDASTLYDIYDIEQKYGVKNLLAKIVRYLNVPLYKMSVMEIDTERIIVSDTIRMKNNFNPCWSISRIHREHDQAVKGAMAKTHTTKPFHSTSFFPAALHNDAGYSAVLLDSPYAVGTHGNEQHHCVGSYIHDMAEGNYVVYKITGPDDVESTLGIANDHGDIMLSDQHFLACNEILKDKEHKAFGTFISARVKQIMKDNPSMVKFIPKPIHNYQNVSW